ncbi:MAG: rhomboid family intramembrane serine protease [Pseudomonadota bacterium]|nr:rhomboid family intramembrane serine protease [Pseudomonadota bacterium]
MATIELIQEPADDWQYPRTQKDTGSSFLSDLYQSRYFITIFMALISVSMTPIILLVVTDMTYMYYSIFASEISYATKMTEKLILMNLSVTGFAGYLMLFSKMISRASTRFVIFSTMYFPKIMNVWAIVPSLFMNLGPLAIGNLTCLYLFGSYIEDYFGSENMMRIYLAGGVVNSIMCTIAGVGVFWGSAMAIVPIIGICMSRKVAPKSELAPGDEVDALDQAVKSDTALVLLGAIYVHRFIVNPVGEIGLFIGLLTGVAFDALERKGYLNGFLLNKEATIDSLDAEKLTSHRTVRQSEVTDRNIECREELAVNADRKLFESTQADLIRKYNPAFW